MTSDVHHLHPEVRRAYHLLCYDVPSYVAIDWAESCLRDPECPADRAALRIAMGEWNAAQQAAETRWARRRYRKAMMLWVLAA